MFLIELAGRSVFDIFYVLEIREILSEPNYYCINDASEAIGVMSPLTCYNLATL